MTLLLLLRPPATVGDRPGTVGVAFAAVATVGVGAVGGEMIDVGDMVRFGNALIDPATGQAQATPPGAFTTGGVATDPTLATLVIVKPDGTRLTYGWPVDGADGSLVRESAGRYFHDDTIDQAGVWRFRLASTGSVVAAAEGMLSIRPRRVGP